VCTKGGVEVEVTGVWLEPQCPGIAVVKTQQPITSKYLEEKL